MPRQEFGILKKRALHGPLTHQFRFPAFVNNHHGMWIETAAGLLDDASPQARIRTEVEDIEVLELTLEEALEMIRTGEIVDGKTTMLLQHAALRMVTTSTAGSGLSINPGR